MMKTTIPVYQKVIDPDTELPVLDRDGLEMVEHVRDIIVPDSPTHQLTKEQIEMLLQEQLLTENL